MRKRRVVLVAPLACFLAALGLDALSAATAHAACSDGLTDQGRVATFADARTVRLDDGRMLRLAGLEAPPEAPSFALPAGTTLRWRASGENDRYGRIVALAAFAETEGAADETLQQAILAQGAALIGLDVPQACLAGFRAAEAVARTAKRGIWTRPSATKNAESMGDHAALVGQFGIFEGKVLSVREAGATLYVNFGNRAAQALTVAVAQGRRRAIEQGGVALTSLQGRRLRVRGFVEERGGVRIDASAPEQIEIMD